jgi:hypothetical protein
MAANNIRQMTRNADLSTHGVAGNQDQVRQMVTEICALQPSPHDGVRIDLATIRTEPMRDEYQGVRCKLVATLGKAQIPFAIDLSFGDPRHATVIQLESIINQPTVRLQAYPLALNLAEKIVTAMQRRETNTRDRDLADLWVTSRTPTRRHRTPRTRTSSRQPSPATDHHDDAGACAHARPPATLCSDGSPHVLPIAASSTLARSTRRSDRLPRPNPQRRQPTVLAWGPRPTAMAFDNELPFG